MKVDLKLYAPDGNLREVTDAIFVARIIKGQFANI